MKTSKLIFLLTPLVYYILSNEIIENYFMSKYPTLNNILN